MLHLRVYPPSLIFFCLGPSASSLLVRSCDVNNKVKVLVNEYASLTQFVAQDLHRTSDDEYFKTTSGRATLARVLLAYSQYNKVGPLALHNYRRLSPVRDEVVAMDTYAEFLFAGCRILPVAKLYWRKHAPSNEQGRPG